MKTTRKMIVKVVMKQHKCSRYIADDIVDQLVWEICDYLDGNHMYSSIEELIKSYIDLPANYSVENVVNTLLN